MVTTRRRTSGIIVVQRSADCLCYASRTSAIHLVPRRVYKKLCWRTLLQLLKSSFRVEEHHVAIRFRLSAHHNVVVNFRRCWICELCFEVVPERRLPECYDRHRNGLERKQRRHQSSVTIRRGRVVIPPAFENDEAIVNLRRPPVVVPVVAPPVAVVIRGTGRSTGHSHLVRRERVGKCVRPMKQKRQDVVDAIRFLIMVG
mmetsp:Transcript_6592/g.16187  ORF Transcript_6592/g.16187 Transcript_6592/m.16187 type:complete len:201 (+) Transcript_6592:2210-2812(+)